MLKATPLEYIKIKKESYEKISKLKNKFINFHKELLLVDSKLGGALRVSAAFITLWLIHEITLLEQTPINNSKNFSYKTIILAYWTFITYGMNITKDIVTSNTPTQWHINTANTDDAAQATVYSLFSILVLQFADYYWASNYSKFLRFLSLAGTNAIWLMSTSFLRGKDKTTIMFNSLRSIIGGIVATPLSVLLYALGMNDTVLQSKTSSELVGGIGEGTIRFYRRRQLRLTKDVNSLLNKLFHQTLTEEEAIKYRLDLLRVWAKVSFGKAALKKALLDEKISYQEAHNFVFTFNKNELFLKFINENILDMRKPEKIKELYEKHIPEFNYWLLKTLLKKKKRQLTITPDSVEKNNIRDIGIYSIELQKMIIQETAQYNLKEAAFLLLQSAKKDINNYYYILKNWDNKFSKERKALIELIKN